MRDKANILETDKCIIEVCYFGRSPKKTDVVKELKEKFKEIGKEKYVEGKSVYIECKNMIKADNLLRESKKKKYYYLSGKLLSEKQFEKWCQRMIEKMDKYGVINNE